MTYGLGWASWEKLGARLTAFVPPETAARVFIIENPPGEVRWRTQLQLSAEARDACFTVARLEDGALRAVNACGGMELFGGCFRTPCASPGWGARPSTSRCPEPARWS